MTAIQLIKTDSANLTNLLFARPFFGVNNVRVVGNVFLLL